MKTKVAVFFGGPSFEHDVSILTGLQVMQVIDITKYEPIPVYVDIDGNWWTTDQDGNLYNTHSKFDDKGLNIDRFK